MGTVTPNLALKKPSPTDNFSVDDYNSNLDALDTAIGAPSSTVASLQVQVNNLVASGVVSTPTTSGMTFSSTVINNLWVKKIGKVAFCRYNLQAIPSNAAALVVNLPDKASMDYTEYGNTEMSVGSFTVHAPTASNPTGSNVAITGAVILKVDPGTGDTTIQFRGAQTKNISSGPYSTTYNTDSGLATGKTTYLSAEFTYELAS